MRKWAVLSIAIVILFILITGCSTKPVEVETTETCPVEIEFSEKNVTLSVGERKMLDLKVQPENAVIQTVSLESSDASVVSTDGMIITAEAEGTAVITASDDTAELGQCLITVKHIQPERLWLETETVEGQIGREIALPLKTYPTVITDEAYNISVANEGIALCRDDKLIGVSSGTTTVTIMHETTGLSVDCALTVTPIALEGFAISECASIFVGDTVTLTAELTPTDTTDKSINWTTSDSSVAGIDADVLTAKKVGTVTITATHASGLSAEKVLEIMPVEPKSLTISCEAGGKLIVGNSSTLVAEILPENTTDKTITWTSSDNDLATVSSSGKVYASRPGEVSITATSSNGIKETYTFIINPKPVTASNGFLLRPSAEREAPVTVHASSTDSCYVYFKCTSDSNKDFSLFVRAGTTTEVEAPIGEYTMYYATGETWYGVEYRFGVGTDYFKADSHFSFYYSGDYVYGTEVTLYAVVGGNMGTDPISENEFPG